MVERKWNFGGTRGSAVLLQDLSQNVLDNKGPERLRSWSRSATVQDVVAPAADIPQVVHQKQIEQRAC